MEYSSLKSPQLKEELKRRGLRASGLKREMVSRLKDADRMYKNNASNKPSIKELINGSSSKSSPDIEQTDGVEHHLLREQHKRDREERASITIWRRPLTTLGYFFMETFVMLVGWCHSLWDNRKKVAVFLLLICSMLTVYHLEGSHQKYIASLRKTILWCWYWLMLGILSSVGLGTGLHTFLLYLGPHIASVTIAAFECMSVDFPEPPYPDEIVCPEETGTIMTIWYVVSKVRLEAFMWGAGTALGELPPYFMAKAARLSGNEPDNEDYEEFEDMMEDISNNPNEQPLSIRLRRYVQTLVQKVGFFGILACASIPNPLFDLAGITCGHFLVDFWTFFGATLIGKAIIKMHIQKFFVIGIFSEHHADMLVDLVGKIPKVGAALQSPFRDYLEKQKRKLHHKAGEHIPQSTNWLSWVFEKVIIVMVIYFVISIVNSMAQRYAKRLQEQARERKKH